MAKNTTAELAREEGKEEGRGRKTQAAELQTEAERRAFALAFLICKEDDDSWLKEDLFERVMLEFDEENPNALSEAEDAWMSGFVSGLQE